MFDADWDELDAAATLDAAVEFDADENRASLGKLEAALHFADLHADLPSSSQHARTVRGGERLVVHGGAGCPAVAEFAPAEFGAVLKLASGTAAAYMGEALALRHRFPKILAKIRNGQAIVWRARTVARACIKLSQEAAALVDERVAPVIDTLSAYRLQKIIDAVIKEVDPDAARKAAEDRARERGVWIDPSDDHGTKSIYVKAAAGDVIRFDATIEDIARALATLGDPDSLSARRAKAIGWIADPAAAYELLAAARYLAAQPNETTAGAERDTDGRDIHETEDGEAGHPEGPEGGQGKTGDSEIGAIGEATAERFGTAEPTADAEADRDAPHPSQSDHLDYLDNLSTADLQDRMVRLAWKRGRLNDDFGDPTRAPANHNVSADNGPEADPFSRQALASRLAAIKQAAYTTGLGRASGPGHGRVVLYVHLTDQTLHTGQGVARLEGHGPVLASQVRELVGHDQVIVKPVIDLNEQISVNAYEIPTRIRERVKLAHPAEPFPYATAETTVRTDLDHIEPYRPNGPPGQTGTTTLAPAARFHHRVKTHGGWQVQRLDQGALQWTTRNGFKFRVDRTGTHRITD
ncbi:MAG TPA: DUF222 domain-containing protein [Kribbella sp.]